MFNNRINTEVERLQNGDFRGGGCLHLSHDQHRAECDSLYDGGAPFEVCQLGEFHAEDDFHGRCNGVKPQLHSPRPSYQRILIAFAVVAVCFWVLITVLAIGFHNGG